MSEVNRKATEVLTGRCRASYVNVFRPRLNTESGKEEYSMTLLVPKSDEKTMAAIKAAAKVALMEKWAGKPPNGLQIPWHDGDGPKPNGGDYGEECRGHWVLNVKTGGNPPRKPGIVDLQRQDIIDPGAFVSGDYCRCTLNAFAYDNRRKGVSFGLNNIQVLARGEALSSAGRRAEDDFDDLPAGEGFGTDVVGAGNTAAPAANARNPWD